MLHFPVLPLAPVRSKCLEPILEASCRFLALAALPPDDLSVSSVSAGAAADGDITMVGYLPSALMISNLKHFYNGCIIMTQILFVAVVFLLFHK